MKEIIPISVTHPTIAAEWHPTKNYPLTPDQVSHGSDKKVWWVCPKGHEYKAKLDHRTRVNSGCPYCAGKKPIVGENDLATTHPLLVEEWDYESNKKAPTEYKAGSNKVVSWVCRECGTRFQKDIVSRVLNNVSCPKCAKERGTSFNEQAIMYYVAKSFDAKNRFRISGCEVDVFIPALKTAIEYNGAYYHRNAGEKDRKKAEFLKDNSIRLITVNEAKENTVNGDIITVNTGTSFHVKDKDLEWVITRVLKKLSITSSDININRDRVQIMEQYKIKNKDNNLEKMFPDIAIEWNYDKNGTLKPSSFAYSSNKKVWWECSKCGKNFHQQISHRTVGGSGCPYCAGKKVIRGLTDLVTTHPDLAEQWHPTKNLPETPDNISSGSDKKFWWQCPKGHEWKAAVSSRTSGHGCPYCAGRKVFVGFNDLASHHPELISEWNYEKNLPLTPETVTYGSNRKVWWKCGKCGYEWKTTIASRSAGCGCLACAGKTVTTGENDLLTTDPEIAAEWHPTANGDLTPDKVMHGSNKKAFWLCPKGHTYETVISNRYYKHSGCQYCSGKRVLKGFNDLATTHPALAAQWHPENNDPLTPFEVSRGSDKKVWWKCSYGHEWQATISSRVAGNGCPLCYKERHSRKS